VFSGAEFGFESLTRHHHVGPEIRSHVFSWLASCSATRRVFLGMDAFTLGAIICLTIAGVGIVASSVAAIVLREGARWRS